MFSLTPPPCEECGYDPVFHFAERSTVAIDAFLSGLMQPVARGLGFVVHPLTRLLEVLSPSGVRVLSRIGLARLSATPGTHSSETAVFLWEEAQRRGIKMQEVFLFGLPRRLFIAEFKGKKIFFEGLPSSGRPQHSLDWIDDKAEMKKRFLKAGFPIAKGGAASTEKEALKIFRGLTAPVIAKPHIGSGGRHTTVHIESEDELLKAFRNAQMLSPYVMIEEELKGPVFRATLIGGKLIAVLRREAPQVVGDGHSTIRELVTEENKNPLREGPAFDKIRLESIPAQKEMVRQGVTEEMVLEKGQRVQFHFKVNWGVGGTSWDATDDVHPTNAKLFEDIGRYLQNDIIGIDFMTPDIGKPWTAVERCGVIECNSLPHISGHHIPFKGSAKDIVGPVWDIAFPGSKKGS